MKKSRLSRVLAMVMAICMVLALAPAALAAENVEILFLNTSDIHGQIYATDYTADASASGTYRQSWTRVATYINEQRAAYDNVFLSDSGDTVQGTPLTYYYAFEEDTLEDPSVKMLRSLDYDMWVLGNHEFNYGLGILNEETDYATSPATETESTVAMSMANYLAAETNSDESKDWATWKGYEPYLLKEYDGVTVAVMGIGNPNIANWDVPENWEGIYFANPVETYLHYEAEMEAAADVIVVVSHSGIDSDPESSDFIRELVETTDSIDLVFTGHEHRNGRVDITNAAGEEIPVIACGTKAAALGRALITVDAATKQIVSVDAESYQMVENRLPKYDVDPEMEALMAPYETATWNDYMLQPIGTATGDFPSANLGSAPSAFMDLVNQVQMWGAYDNNGLNTPDDPTDDTPAQLSISAPLTSGDAENLIPEGEIYLGDMFKLYRYENWFYQITMSGKEVRTWLEAAATLINDEGQVTGYDLTYYDVIYGEGFSYTLDYGMPEGFRVTSMTYNGEEVADDDTFTVVVNNYRYNGGGGYIQYLNDHGCDFIPNDENRVIYSTQYDMIQGEDLGQARNLLANYISMKGQIAPDITSTWKVINSTDNEYTFAVVSTTDMHGRSTKYDVATQTEDVNSMIRAHMIISHNQEKYGDDLIVIDNGDTIQGNLVAQYAITQKADVINPMIELMADAGYDAWVMGNHEFNFNPTQRDTQMAYAAEGGITTIAANITLVEDGKNAAGEDAKAGDPYYTPYIIKTLTAENGVEVNVAIIGLGNPANATWDIASNYPNMQFNSLENPDGDLAYEVNKWVDYVNENEDVDLIIVSTHTGRGDEEGSSLEDQTLYAAMNTSGVDLFIYGHDHTANVEAVTNADGEEVYIMNGGGTNVTNNEFTVTFDENGEIANVTVTAKNQALANVGGMPETAEMTQHWYDETYAWASAPLGTFDGGWNDYVAQAEGKHNSEMVTSQTALVDFVHKGQIWASWQSYETDGIEGATVSIGSAVFAEDWTQGGILGFVPTDGTTISTLELNKLYRYSNNLLTAVDMTGEQLYAWMSKVADKYAVDENGTVYLTDSVFGVDTFYGVDYTIDLTKPLGERLVKATYQGQDLKTYEGKIRCTLNSYRLSGGYGFYEATGLTEADCCWTASQYLGADRAPVPTMLGEYVAYMGTVSPTDPVYKGEDTTWSISLEPVSRYKDVESGRFYTEAVEGLTEWGIVNGMTADTFGVNSNLTRAQWVTMLYRSTCYLEGEEPECTLTESSFTDVETNRYYTQAMLWAEEQGIVKGYTNGTCKPEQSITREEMAVMLYRWSGSYIDDEIEAVDLTKFTDAEDISGWAEDAVKYCVYLGLLKGMDDGSMAPAALSTRAQAATVLWRALNLGFGG